MMFKEIVETVATHPFAFVLLMMGVTGILAAVGNLVSKMKR